MTVRLAGAGLLGLCLFAVYRLHALVTMMPRHQPTPAEMLLSFLCVLAGMGGAMAVLVGSNLFRSASRPQRFREPRSIDN
jgi:hypothetical protein